VNCVEEKHDVAPIFKIDEKNQLRNANFNYAIKNESF
jgi:hypothetical protein